MSINKNFQSGQALILTLLVLAMVVIGSLALISGSLNFDLNSRYSIDRIQATNLAEAGVDKAVASLNAIGNSYAGETETALGSGTYSVSITSINPGTKLIESTGYIPNKTNAKAKRTVKIQVSSGVGASFVYGIQVGEGGLALGNNNQVNGSIYSNGNVTGGNHNTITGDAWVAGGPQPTPDQETDCQGVNCLDYDFGQNIGGENRMDVAQSFTAGGSNVLNKISIKVKRFDNPPDATVRIVSDNAGKPDKNNVLTSGILYSSLATTSFGWIDVTFNSLPNLNSGTKYWIMINTPSSTNGYWSWQNDSLQSYTRGSSAWSVNWQAKNPAWTSINGDLSFKTFMGGVPTLINGGNDFIVGGDVHANTISNLEITKDAYFQSISSSTVGGQSYPGSADPPPKVFPISDANITQWKNDAAAVGVHSGDINTCVSNLNAGKYIGNVIFDNNCTVTVKSVVWITGNLILNNSNTLRLDSSYGGSSGVVIVDGTITMGNSNKLLGTGTGNSILMALTTFDSRSNDITAIDVNNTGNTGVLYADKGIIQPGNGNNFKELTAWGIRIMNNSTLTYDSGLSSTLFSSGPSGSYSAIKGTYQAN